MCNLYPPDLSNRVMRASTSQNLQIISIPFLLHLCNLYKLLYRLVLIALVVEVLLPVTWQCKSEGWHGGAFVRLYLCGMLALQATLMLLLAALAQQSARGTITDVDSRKLVAPLLLIKLVYFCNATINAVHLPIVSIQLELHCFIKFTCH